MKTDKPNIRDSKLAKKRKRIKRLGIWLVIELIVAIIILSLIFNSPSNYRQAKPIESDQVSLYLTNYLMTKIYRGAQQQKPFALLVHQDGINDIIARRDWPVQADELTIYTPQAIFTDKTITLMGTVGYKGADLVITVEAMPALDDNGLLNFNISHLRVGSMNITMLAKFVASKMYRKRLTDYDIDTSTLEARIAGAILSGVGFEPVFKVEDKYIRIKSLALSEGKLDIDFVPAGK